ncbi:MAG: ATP-binding protein [Coriobacteriia bacterium]|nr:ATP-binding protein [Coriobacteriia bacterium]
MGKSTLAKMLVEDGTVQRYLTLDQLAVLDGARTDPEGFIAGAGASAVIDEIQLAPELFRAIKYEVDRDRRPGRFLLTGSADLSVLPAAAEALVGRLEVLTLGPLTQAELRSKRGSFVDTTFSASGRWLEGEGFDRAALAEAICLGGFPEPVSRERADREPWHRSYVDLVVRRDIALRTDIAGLAAVPRLLALLSARTMTLVSLAEVARSMEMPASTVRRYVALLEAAMLVRMVPAFAPDIARRMVKSPKIAIIDTGLAAALSGLDVERLLADPSQMGRLAESFVVNELQRQAAWAKTRVRLMHTRTVAGREVDIVLESSDGRICGVEVKTGKSVGSADFRGLKALEEATGERFFRGILLYTGDVAVPFGSNLQAVPMSALWGASFD